ncbi:MAG: DUF2955 domain-containing protein, partial [Woeseiaceae bacterium]
STRILRLALGTALALWFSQAVGWSLSYIAPIFTLLLLATPKPAMPLKGGVAIVVLIMAAAYGGLLLLPMLIHQTAAGILILTLALFYTFYFTARSDSLAVGTLMIVGLTLTVTVGSVSVDAVLAVAKYVSIGALVGMLFVWLAHAIVPDPAVSCPAASRPPRAPEKPSAATARRSAMRSLAIVLPVAIVFLFSGESASYMAVMIKVTSMTQQVSSGKTREVASSLLLATLIGGLAALAGWMLIGVWPMLTLYTLLIALAGLMMGRRIFAGGGMAGEAATWSYAYLTMIVILAPAVMDSLTGSTAGLAFIDRLLMFVGATVYGVVAVYTFDAFWPDEQRHENAASTLQNST